MKARHPSPPIRAAPASGGMTSARPTPYETAAVGPHSAGQNGLVTAGRSAEANTHRLRHAMESNRDPVRFAVSMAGRRTLRLSEPVELWVGSAQERPQAVEMRCDPHVLVSGRSWCRLPAASASSHTRGSVDLSRGDITEPRAPPQGGRTVLPREVASPARRRSAPRYASRRASCASSRGRRPVGVHGSQSYGATESRVQTLASALSRRRPDPPRSRDS